ncbi:hypothetical protein DFA_01392 [Cavenderia fasciculata]|uniref:Uncharacterized protein n=1 Tax=Cavenderia fasciculata TaxID=261658 RepID=F4PSH6_CACFS|nr:uncharacterized protein DFA_01392 [Cavenderia fasciculata]EGG21506.1 hypothetical protein DFA_01392 [Cavenderia fasciculata]|eukprot:XP_004359356.1 hypothetical protein DFA_01392 [Cavenderia fasciculata]
MSNINSTVKQLLVAILLVLAIIHLPVCQSVIGVYCATPGQECIVAVSKWSAESQDDNDEQ